MLSNVEKMKYSIISKELIEILEMYRVLGSLNELGQFIFSKLESASSWSLNAIYKDLVHLEENMEMTTKLPFTSLLLRDILGH